MREPQQSQRSWPGFWLQPKIALPLLIFVGVISTPLIIRTSSLLRVPEIELPFDRAAFFVSDPEIAEEEWQGSSPVVGNMCREHKVKDLFELNNKKRIDIHRLIDKKLGDADYDAETISLFYNLNMSLVHQLQRSRMESISLQSHVAGPLHLNQNSSVIIREIGILNSRIAMEAGLQREWLRERDEILKNFRLSRKLGRKATRDERLFGMDLHAQAAKDLARWAANPEVGVEQLEFALNAVRSDFRLTAPASEALKVEYLLFEKRVKTGLLDSLNGFDPKAGMFKHSEYLAKSWWLWMLGEPEVSLRLHRHRLANQLAEVDRPLCEQQPQFADELLFEPRPGTAAAKALPPVRINELNRTLEISQRIGIIHYQDYEREYRREAVRQIALEIALAAQIHQRLKGYFPSSLSDLVPAWFESVPRDPFSKTGAPMIYRITSEQAAQICSSTFDDFDDSEMSFGSRVWLRIIK